MQLQEKNWDAIRAKRLLIENCRKIVYCTTALWISWYLFDFLLVCCVCCCCCLAVFLFLLLLFVFPKAFRLSFFYIPFLHCYLAIKVGTNYTRIEREHVIFPEYTWTCMNEMYAQMYAFFVWFECVYRWFLGHMPLVNIEVLCYAWSVMTTTTTTTTTTTASMFARSLSHASFGIRMLLVCAWMSMCQIK